MLPRRAFLLAAFALAACGDKGARKNLDEGAVFLARNAKDKDIVALKSGLQYRVLRSGPATGLKPKLGDEVKVHYEGKLLNGETFDSSFERGAPTVFTLRNGGLIKGWIEALQLMRPGDEWQVYIPGDLAYGADGKGPIPPNAVLVFKIELIDVLPGETSTGKA